MSQPASHALLQRLLLAASTGLAACGGSVVDDTGSRTGDEGAGGAAGTGVSGSSGQSAAGSSPAGEGGSAGASQVGGAGGSAGTWGSLECEAASECKSGDPPHGCSLACYTPGEGGNPTTCLDATDPALLGKPLINLQCGIFGVISGPYCRLAASNNGAGPDVPVCCYDVDYQVCVGRPLRVGSQGRTAPLRPVAW